MTNQGIFKNCIDTIAEINHVISTLDNIGLVTEDKSFDGALYKSLNGVINIAMDAIRIGDENASEFNNVFSEVISVTRENKDEVINWVLREHYHGY